MSAPADQHATGPAVPALRVGVIGLGFMGRTHLGAYQAAARDGLPAVLAAVADRDAARLAGRPAGGGNPELGAPSAALFDPAAVRAFDDPPALLREAGLHLVSICTPTDTHVPLATAALEAGVHVLLEKPVAVRAADVRRLRDAARASGRLCMPAMCMRFWPGWAWLKERVDDATLGPVRSAVFQRLGSPPDWGRAFYGDPSRSGGALVDLHIHDADFVRWCFGTPAQVSSAGTLSHVSTLYRYAPGRGPAHVLAEGGQDHAPGFGFVMRYVVVFEHATADFDLARGDAALRLVRDGQSTTVPLPTLSGYDAQVRHMIDAVAAMRAGRSAPPLRATLDDAVAVAELLEAERRSLESGLSVPTGEGGANLGGA